MRLEIKMGLWYLKSIKTYINLHVALVLFRATLIFQPTSNNKVWDNFWSTTVSSLSWVNKWMKIKISCCSIHTYEILILFSSRWNTLSALLRLLCRATGINMPAIPREKCKWKVIIIIQDFSHPPWHVSWNEAIIRPCFEVRLRKMQTINSFHFWWIDICSIKMLLIPYLIHLNADMSP